MLGMGTTPGQFASQPSQASRGRATIAAEEPPGRGPLAGVNLARLPERHASRRKNAETAQLDLHGSTRETGTTLQLGLHPDLQEMRLELETFTLKLGPAIACLSSLPLVLKFGFIGLSRTLLLMLYKSYL